VNTWATATAVSAAMPANASANHHRMLNRARRTPRVCADGPLLEWSFQKP
jgi:hypothetical protein